MDITYLYPQVLPLDKSGKIYEGFITLNGESHAVALDESQTWCDWNNLLHCKARGGRDSNKSASLPITKRLEEASKELASVSVGRTAISAASVEFYKTLVEEIEELGWSHVDDVSDDVTRLTLRFGAAEGTAEVHRLEVTYPGPTLRADLPERLTRSWSRQGRLAQLFAQFVDSVERAAPLWRQLDSLDRALWILEPERPTRADVVRRVAIGDGASLLVELDPDRPHDVPRLQFLGPEAVIGLLRERAGAAHQLWTPGAALVDNLKEVLQTDFPTRERTALEDVCQQCGVCYAFNLEGSLPSVSCSNAHCHQLFHPSCIYDWLRTLPSTRQIFNNVHGECPYCSEMIVAGVVLEK